MSPPRREILLTLTPAQHAALARDLDRLRRHLGTDNATLTIIEAVRRTSASEQGLKAGPASLVRSRG